MAIPIWIPLALSAAGVGLNQAAQAKSRRRAKAVTQAELERQRKQRGKAQEVLAESRAAMESKPESIAEEQTSLGEQFKKAAEISPGEDYAIVSADMAPAEVISYQEEALGKAGEKAAERAQLLANLSGYGQDLFGSNLALQDAGMDLGVISDASRGSLRAFDAELEEAARAGDSLATLGQIFGTAGMVTGMAGGMAPTGPGTGFTEGVTAVNYQPNIYGTMGYNPYAMV